MSIIYTINSDWVVLITGIKPESIISSTIYLAAYRCTDFCTSPYVVSVQTVGRGTISFLGP